MLLTAIYTDSGNAEGARKALRETERAVDRMDTDSPLPDAALAGLEATIALLEGNPAAAAAAYAAQADRLRMAGSLAGMTEAQQRTRRWACRVRQRRITCVPLAGCRPGGWTRRRHGCLRAHRRRRLSRVMSS